MVSLDAEVAVVGVGSMGSMAMWRLTARGIRTIGFEQFGIGHDRGGAGGESRQFRDRLLEPAVLPVMSNTRALYEQLETASGRSLLLQYGGLSIGWENSPIITGTLERATAEGVPVRLMSAGELVSEYPQHRIRAGEVAIHEPYSAVIRPELSVVSAVEVARRAGGVVHTGTRVSSIDDAGDHVVVRTSERSYTAGKVIVASGPWTFRLLPRIAAGTHIRRIVMTWFPVDDVTSFSPERFPTWSRILDDGMPAFGVPALDGGSVKVAVVESYGDFHDADTLDREVSRSDVLRASAVARESLAGVGEDPVRASVYMDGYTPDEQPVVGLLPGSDNIVVAAGFSGRGFKMTPSIGEILAQLAVGEPVPADLSMWAPARFASA